MDSNFCCYCFWILEPCQHHRSDSHQGTDYIANDFLNLRVSRTKIKMTNWEHIISLTFGKFVTLCVQKLRILKDNKNLRVKVLTTNQFLS